VNKPLLAAGHVSRRFELFHDWITESLMEPIIICTLYKSVALDDYKTMRGP